MKQYKYYGPKRVARIREKARKIAKAIPMDKRKYTTLNKNLEEVEKTHTLNYYENRYTKEYLENPSESLINDVYSHSSKMKFDDIVEFESYMQPFYMQKSANLSFYEKYKDEEYNGKTIRQYFNQLKNKKISQDELNSVLENFKKRNEKYLKSGSS